jgi:hypothetical protein
MFEECEGCGEVCTPNNGAVEIDGMWFCSEECAEECA